jgi:hypothetical protein
MQEPEDPNLGANHLIHHPIIPDAELPISLSGTPQGFSILLGS